MSTSPRRTVRRCGTKPPFWRPILRSASATGARRLSGFLQILSAMMSDVRYALALVAVTGLIVPPAEVPREWVESTGHRVVRLSDEAGTASLYFHQNPYTAKGDKMVVSTPK